jgi:hypothetical protein
MKKFLHRESWLWQISFPESRFAYVSPRANLSRSRTRREVCFSESAWEMDIHQNSFGMKINAACGVLNMLWHLHSARSDNIYTHARWNVCVSSICLYIFRRAAIARAKMRCWSLLSHATIYAECVSHWQQAACIDYDIIFTLLSIWSHEARSGCATIWSSDAGENRLLIWHSTIQFRTRRFHILWFHPILAF